MVELDLTPDIVDFITYAGDTFAFSVIVEDAPLEGMDWLAQVRTSRDSDVTEATFEVLRIEEGVVLALSSVVMGALANSGVLMSARQIRDKYPTLAPRVAALGAEKMMVFSGVYDVQISEPGELDPVITVIQGALVICADVTRSGP